MDKDIYDIPPRETYPALHLFKNREDSPASHPVQDRPRERLISYGPEALSDMELLSIMLNAGVKGRGVYTLAKELLHLLDNGNAIPPLEEIISLEGFGETKSCSILAMLEFGRRRWGPRGVRIKTPDDAYKMIRHFGSRSQEHFICLSLNGAHELLACRTVTIGLVNRTVVHPREVFSDPLLDRASAVIVAHNHPSGQLLASKEDDEITFRLSSAAELLGIKLLDHLVFSLEGYYSYSLQGKMEGYHT